MRPNLTRIIGDYIKAIHELSRVDGRATTQRLAESLGVTPASLTGIVKKARRHTPAAGAVLPAPRRGVDSSG